MMLGSHSSAVALMRLMLRGKVPKPLLLQLLLVAKAMDARRVQRSFIPRMIIALSCALDKALSPAIGGTIEL